MPIHEPPKKLIRFLGKTGFISRELWEEFFFLRGKERWRRIAWNNLLAHRYCVPHPERHLRNVYVLNRHNPVVRQLVTGRMVSPQRATYFEHDETLYRGLLMAEQSGFISDWMAEPELKAAKGSTYRIESTNGSAKYPDALVFPAWVTNSKPIAIECELTLKAPKRYEQIMAAYAAMKDLGTILFVTDHAAVERSVRRAMEEHRYGKGSPAVEFYSVEAWTNDSKKLFETLCRSRTASAQPKVV